LGLATTTIMMGDDMAAQRQIATVQRVAESYPASPMQQGMLLHSLAEPHCGVDIEQILCTLPKELNVPAFRQAWEGVVERHTILRTGFSLAGLEPRQEVHRRVRLHFEQKDWRGLTQRAQEDRLNAYLNAQRRRGFELSVPPLMRLALFRAGEAKHILAWTFHHLLLDSRALVVLLQEVFQSYEAVCEGRDLKLPAPRPYRDYIDWLGICVEWNDTETDFPRDKCIPELFETQVERTPNAVALVYTKEEVSYRELDNQTNRVAHHLRSLLLTSDRTCRSAFV
jgi:non-ribosomal peptide synthetase component F